MYRGGWLKIIARLKEVSQYIHPYIVHNHVRIAPVYNLFRYLEIDKTCRFLSHASGRQALHA